MPKIISLKHDIQPFLESQRARNTRRIVYKWVKKEVNIAFKVSISEKQPWYHTQNSWNRNAHDFPFQLWVSVSYLVSIYQSLSISVFSIGSFYLRIWNFSVKKLHMLRILQNRCWLKGIAYCIWLKSHKQADFMYTSIRQMYDIMIFMLLFVVFRDVPVCISKSTDQEICLNFEIFKF